MGILKNPEKFVRDLRLKAGFAVIELGDQYITHTTPHRLAKEFYEEIGCGRYEAVDGNGRGSITADLNLPLAAWPAKFGKLWEAFDLVTDFGTGEHIFDQAQVWKTVHALCKVGGYIVFDRPISGYGVHGYYSVNECLLRDIASANNYDLLVLQWEKTKRGKLMRGVYRKNMDRAFVIPQQGRYHKILKPIMEKK